VKRAKGILSPSKFFLEKPWREHRPIEIHSGARGNILAGPLWGKYS